MSSSTRLFLARHGRTALNAGDRLRGLADPPLDDVGARDATGMARELASASFSVVLSSPLQRAVVTAACVARAAGVPSRIDERLNDRDYGAWTGRLRTDVVAEWGSLDAAPGVEPTDLVLERVLPLLEEVRVSGDCVVMVTHDAVIRPLIERFGLPQRRISVLTASWCVLSSHRTGWTVESVDNVAPDRLG